MLALATVCAGAVWAPDTRAESDRREARAIEALGRMGTYLRSLKQFRIRATTTTDEVLEDGQKLQFGGVIDYRVRQPDGLRADLRNDRVQRQFYYDGVSFTQFAPKVGYYATVAAADTIAATLGQANAKFDLELPLADLFLWGTERAGIGEIREATLVGASSIGGVAVDHFAYRQDDVDWQIWIAQGTRPLPLKLVITTKADPAQPQFTAMLRWDTRARFDDAIFQFVPPSNARRIVLADTPRARD